MVHARRKVQRSSIVAQAGLVWAMFEGVSPEDLQEFIRSGDLPGSASDVLPYNDAVVKRIAEKGM